jgi:hypothetical protein
MQRDTLTPLDARNSLLKMGRTESKESTTSSFDRLVMVGDSKEINNNISYDIPSHERLQSPPHARTTLGYIQAPTPSRALTPAAPFGANQSRENLVDHAASIDREPTIPNLGNFGTSRPYQGRYGPRGHSSYRTPSRAPSMAPSVF